MGVRKCSKCGQTGHNSRTCRNLSSSSSNGQIMKLFGVELTNLPTEMSSSNEYSDKLKHIGPAPGQRKKGIAWSEEEHRLFLEGLEKLGKGNWRGISRNFVTTRTSTQVASHAQKYFIRRNNNANKNKSPIPILSMMRRNEAPPCCIYLKKLPNNPLPTSSEVTYTSRLFNNSATQNSPSLELTLAVPPPPPPLIWDRRPVVLWKKQYLANRFN